MYERAPQPCEQGSVMAFGLAEVLADGWIQLDEYPFEMKETAITVAVAWARLKQLPRVGVVDTEQHKLVWRSDQGLLSLPCLGRKTGPSR